MKHWSSVALGLSGSCLILSIILVSAPVHLSAGQGPSAEAEDPATPVFAQTCIKCHDGARILATRRTQIDWEETIQKMIEKGATGSGEDFETVFDYLVRSYGKVYVNQASAAEIAKVLNISGKEADALVAYRIAHGPFADCEALKKVPGIDLKVLDAHPDAVAF